ncbi:MAG: type II toxin-antitoxin system HicB family antitoxin [Candidatus Micrarchaeota archaeon]
MQMMGFSVVIIPEGKSFSAWCPDVDVASQGKTVKESLTNLKEALELHLECLSSRELNEIRKRQENRLTTTIQIPVPA